MKTIREKIRRSVDSEFVKTCHEHVIYQQNTNFRIYFQKRPEVAAIPDLPPNPAKYCSHKVAIANLAKVMSSPGYRPGQFRHVHDPSQPGKKSGKKKSRKKRPYSGILTQQMIESRENERQRINEVT